MFDKAKYTLAIDFGAKRCGVASNDGLSTLAFGEGTYSPIDLKKYLIQFNQDHAMDTLVIGESKQLDNSENEIERDIQTFIEWLENTFPAVKIERQDERFTSKIAMQAIGNSGMAKKKRQDKALLDKTSAILILQGYLDRKSFI